VRIGVVLSCEFRRRQSSKIGLYARPVLAGVAPRRWLVLGDDDARAPVDQPNVEGSQPRKQEGPAPANFFKLCFVLRCGRRGISRHGFSSHSQQRRRGVTRPLTTALRSLVRPASPRIRFVAWLHNPVYGPREADSLGPWDQQVGRGLAVFVTASRPGVQHDDTRGLTSADRCSARLNLMLDGPLRVGQGEGSQLVAVSNTSNFAQEPL
jgi:hypothetical protein